MSEIKRKPWVISGTSGSTDYLKDTTGDRRYWPVSVPSGEASPIVNEVDAEIVKKFVESTAGKWIVEPKPKALADEAACDGLHAEGAPPHHLCSRCYPDLNDLDGGADLVEYDGEVHRDEP